MKKKVFIGIIVFLIIATIIHTAIGSFLAWGFVIFLEIKRIENKNGKNINTHIT